MKQNCWEFKKCGLEPEGENVGEEGPCPASIAIGYQGKNMGQFGGRYCWRVQGTMCDINSKGHAPTKLFKCIECEFYKMVQDEQGANFEM
jgi:hypothetical protein